MPKNGGSWLPEWMIVRDDVCPKCDRLEPDHYVFECPGHALNLETRIRRAREFRIWWMLSMQGEQWLLDQMPVAWCN